MLQFIVLGLVPGTDLQITFLWTVYMLIAIFVIVFLAITIRPIRNLIIRTSTSAYKLSLMGYRDGLRLGAKLMDQVKVYLHKALVHLG